MTKEEFFNIVDKYVRKEASDSEKLLVDRFFQVLENGEEPEWSLSKEEVKEMEMLGRIKQSIKDHEASTKSLWFSKRFIWRAASILIVFASAVWYFSHPPETTIITRATNKGEKARLTLADGSHVTLNAESSLTYPENFDGMDTRKVDLTGEAFFDITKNKNQPFVIGAGKLETMVLGTSFNINAYPENDLISVTVKTGKVRISSKEDNEFLLLTPGEEGAFSLATGALSRKEINPSRIAEWQNGTLRFTNHTIYEMIPDLERWYGVTITCKEKKKNACKLKLAFEDLSFSQAMKQLELTAGIKYIKVSDKSYEITDVGCINPD